MHAHWNPYWTEGVRLHGGSWIIAALIALWLLVGEPWLGRAGFRRFLHALDNGDPNARVRFYRSWTIQAWVLMTLLLVLALAVFAWTPDQLGLRAPRLPASIPWDSLWPLVLGASVCVALGIVVALRAARRKPPRARPPSNAKALRMLPCTPDERRSFSLLAVTAGITEEVIWRGLLLALLVAAFPGLPILALGVAMAAMFGWAHLYQGAGGILGTAILGGLLTALYLATGSLLLPILAHAAIDLLAMLRTPGRKAGVP